MIYEIVTVSLAIIVLIVAMRRWNKYQYSKYSDFFEKTKEEQFYSVDFWDEKKLNNSFVLVGIGGDDNNDVKVERAISTINVPINAKIKVRR